MPNQWFKFYGGEYLSDPKMLALSAAERSCWLTLLCYASVTNGEIRFLTESRLMTQAGVDQTREEWTETTGVLNKFSQLGMIEISEKVIRIVNWNKRQERQLTGAERQAKFRAKQKSNDEVTDVRHESNARIEENRIDKSREEKILDRQEAIVDAFEAFWKEYPRKVGKGAARKAWAKIKKPATFLPRVLVSIEEHKMTEQWTKDGGRFIPHPATFLNQERWDDEVKPQQKLEPIIL